VITDAVAEFTTIGVAFDAMVATGLFVVELLVTGVVVELFVVQVLVASEILVRVELVVKYSAGPYWHHEEEMPQLQRPR
jgi:hypothetical protein